MQTRDRPLTEDEQTKVQKLIEYCKENQETLKHVTPNAPIKLLVSVDELGGNVKVVQGKDTCLNLSASWKPTEKRFLHEERELCVLYRFYPYL